MTEAQARQVILAAIVEGWPDKEVTPNDGVVSYQFSAWFAIDHDRIKSVVVPVEGGYRFELTNRGTAPVAGIPARKKLVEIIEQRVAKQILANVTGTPFPRVLGGNGCVRPCAGKCK